jgi:hypothetical protein
MRGRPHSRVKICAFTLVICGWTSSAIASICAETSEFRPAQYNQVFSGLVISTERIDKAMSVAVAPGENVVEYPGYWIRSRILVLRIWQGVPPMVAELWTPVVTDGDAPPIPASLFVALVRSEKGRSVASNSICDGPRKAAATSGRGTFAVAGIAIIAAAVCAAAIALLSLVRIVRRRRPSR